MANEPRRWGAFYRRTRAEHDTDTDFSQAEVDSLLNEHAVVTMAKVGVPHLLFFRTEVGTEFVDYRWEAVEL